MMVEICFFFIFVQKAEKKEEKAGKLRQNLAKNVYFEFAPKRW